MCVMRADDYDEPNKADTNQDHHNMYGNGYSIQILPQNF